MEFNKKFWIVRKMGRSGRLLIPENIVNELRGKYVLIIFQPVDEIIPITQVNKEVK